MTDHNRMLEDELSKFRESTGRSKNLDNPAKSLVRNLGNEDNLLSAEFKLRYALRMVDDLSRSIDLLNKIDKGKQVSDD